jgi:hypothetical protein
VLLSYSITTHITLQYICSTPLSPSSFSHLPFCLLTSQESLQNRDNIQQSRQPFLQFLRNLPLIITKLSIKVFSVWTCGHRGGEYGLHHEGVMGFKGRAVGIAEGGGDFFAGGVEVSGYGEGGEVESSDIDC